MTDRFKPAVTADIVVWRYKNKSYQVLLVKRAKEPFLHKWALPGGHFEDTDKSITHAAQRELREETGIHVKKKKLHSVCIADAPDRDPRGRVISFLYMTKIKHEIDVIVGDDVNDYKWVDTFNLDNESIAFDHYELIMAAFDRM